MAKKATMRLSNAEEVKAYSLGLTLPEMRVAKSMGISAETWARHSREIAAEKAAEDETSA